MTTASVFTIRGKSIVVSIDPLIVRFSGGMNDTKLSIGGAPGVAYGAGTQNVLLAVAGTATSFDANWTGLLPRDPGAYFNPYTEIVFSAPESLSIQAVPGHPSTFELIVHSDGALLGVENHSRLPFTLPNGGSPVEWSSNGGEGGPHEPP